MLSYIIAQVLITSFLNHFGRHLTNCLLLQFRPLHSLNLNNYIVLIYTTTSIQAEILMIHCLNHFGRHLTNCLLFQFCNTAFQSPHFLYPGTSPNDQYSSLFWQAFNQLASSFNFIKLLSNRLLLFYFSN